MGGDLEGSWGQMTKVLIVDDSDSMRLLVRLTLEMDPSFEVVGEAAHGLDGLRKAETLAPDLVVMDLSMPVMDGIEATRRIKQLRPEIGIVAFTAAAEESIVEKALAAGAATRIDKENLIGLMHALQDLAPKDVVVGPVPPVGVARWWEDVRRSAAAFVGSLRASTKGFGRARAAGALVVGGAGAMAVVMFLAMIAPEGGVSPRAVPEPRTDEFATAPVVGEIDLDAGAVDVDRERAGDDAGVGSDTAEQTITVEVAVLETAPGGTGAPPPANGEDRGNGDGNGKGPSGHGSGHGPGNHPDEGPPGSEPPGSEPPGDGPGGSEPPGGDGSGGGPAGHTPPGQAEGGPPGLAKKNTGGLPPGQAKKNEGTAGPSSKTTPPGQAKGSNGKGPKNK
jgi:CheY-like chemotaxis protein